MNRCNLNEGDVDKIARLTCKCRRKSPTRGIAASREEGREAGEEEQEKNLPPSPPSPSLTVSRKGNTHTQECANRGLAKPSLPPGCDYIRVIFELTEIYGPLALGLTTLAFGLSRDNLFCSRERTTGPALSKWRQDKMT
uniref:Uncharacterized protein n=1 Tax=Anopheles maculatus TaxID=74869 RepID=A0A182SY87_9DIPT